MKKYLLSIAVLVAIVTSGCSPLKFQKPTVQVDPIVPRGYVWDIPKTEDMLFTNILREVRPIPAYDYKGDAILVLVSKKMYDYLAEEMIKAKKFVTKEDMQNGIFFGLDLAVSHMGKISLLTNEQIRQLKTPEERNMAIALNDYTKYTLLGESTRPIIGHRNLEGKYMPVFNPTISFERKIPSVPETFDGGSKTAPSPSDIWMKSSRGN